MAKVMVVDDVPIMRHTIKRHIEKFGHNVVTEASNGFEAISFYSRHKADIVTLDITMPAVNGIKSGIDVIEHIIAINKDVKIIMMTSHGEEKLVIDAVTRGAKGYLLKPITEDKLANIFKKIL